MPSSNKTDILKLNQYLGTDKPSHIDYNDDMKKIDSKLLDLQNYKSMQLIRNVPPTLKDDITQNIIDGDTWTVPNITFHNLVKNATNLQVSDWNSSVGCKLEKSLTGLNLLDNEYGEDYLSATQNTGVEVKPNHKYYITCAIAIVPETDNYYKLSAMCGTTNLVDIKTQGDVAKTSAVFIASPDATGTIDFIIGHGDNREMVQPGNMYFGFFNLIDLTEDMGQGLEFTKEEADNYFEFNPKTITDFSNQDEERVRDIILKKIVPTQQDYEKYDLNGDGLIDITDKVIIRQIMLGKFYDKDDLFQVKPYKYSGSYQCLSNGENKAVWQRTDIPRVGQPYFSLDPTSPAEIYGGVWEKIEERMLFGASAKYKAGSIGGSETVSLTGVQNGPHKHYVAHNNSGGYDSGGEITCQYAVQRNTFWGVPTNMSGNGEPHNNMPPYVAIYIWKRIA